MNDQFGMKEKLDSLSKTTRIGYNRLTSSNLRDRQHQRLKKNENATRLCIIVELLTDRFRVI